VPPAAVLFDNDGLLLDTEPLWTIAEARLFERRGLSFGLDEKRALIGTTAAVTAARLEGFLDAPGDGPALLAELEALAAEEFERDVAVMTGARDLLAALADAGTPVGLVSNSPIKLVSLALRSAGLQEAFPFVLTPAEGLRPKPAPDLYLEGCRRLDVAPADSVALEDTATGVASASAAGMKVVGVPSLSGIDLSEADLVASSLADEPVLRLLGLGG
jgi:HAD superfamily hydrolase (TIGR01509 family)